MRLTNYAENLIVRHLLNGETITPVGSPYFGLFSAISEYDDGTGTEAAGGGYSRRAVTMDVLDEDQLMRTNVNALTMSLPKGTWTHGVIFDAPSGGNALFYGPLVAPKTTTSGQALIVERGAVRASLSGNLTPAFASRVFSMLFYGVVRDPADLWLHLCTAPLVDLPFDPLEGEEGDYAPGWVQLTPPMNGVASNTEVVVVEGATSGGLPLTHAFVSNVESAVITPLLSGPLATPIPDPEGTEIRFEIGDFEVTLS